MPVKDSKNLQDLADDVDAIKTDIDTLATQNTTLATELATIDTSIDAIKVDIDTLATQVTTIATEAGTIDTAIGTLKDDHALIKADVDAIRVAQEAILAKMVKGTRPTNVPDTATAWTATHATAIGGNETVQSIKAATAAKKKWIGAIYAAQSKTGTAKALVRIRQITNGSATLLNMQVPSFSQAAEPKPMLLPFEACEVAASCGIGGFSVGSNGNLFLTVQGWDEA